MKIFLVLLPLSIVFNTYGEMTLTQQLDEKKSASAQTMPPKISAEFTRALKELKESGIEQKAIQKGTTVPNFKIDNIAFHNFYSKRPVILKFYRGSWCPYCQMELKAYEKYKIQIEKKGYQIIVLTPDSKNEILKFKKKQGISLDIYQDKDNLIAKKFGIAFKLDKEVGKIYKQFGINLDTSQENSLGELPLPGTYIINTKGEITYAFIDADYTQRLDPEVLLKML